MGRITVATDGTTTGTAAVRWAARDAAMRGCPLRIVHVLPPVGEWVRPVAGSASVDAGRKVVAEAATAARGVNPSGTVTTAIRRGPIAEELGAVDALVLGTERHGSLAALVISTACGRIVERTMPPVVVVRDVPETHHGEIVVGFDRSAGARHALRFAFDEAANRGARVRVVVGWTVAATGYEFGFGTVPDGVLAEDQRAVEDEIATWAAAYPHVEVETTIRLQNPVTALAAASAHADLVVVGSRGRGTVRSALLGSVSHGVLRHARCPVAVVGQIRTPREQ